MASVLGLEDEFRLARAMASWQRLVAERVPAAAGATEVLEIGHGMMVVGATEPIVAQEIRLRSAELLEGFRTAPGGLAIRELKVVVRRH
jgi:Dna[CI] antecedent, DciA